MRLLILGGTVFLGRHVIDAALARGHTVTMLNRGRRGRDLFPEVERLVGDRDGDMSALRGRDFDAVIDCSGYTPAQIERALAALDTGAPQVVFVSSISAYGRFVPDKVYDEASPLAAGHEGYGALKARAEEALAHALPDRHTLVRPGLIVGPHDPTGRFTYWPERVARGGEVLAPGRPDRPVQFIDARDLARFCVTLAETRVTGAFNAIGHRLPMRELLDACVAAAPGTDARFTWIDDEALLALEVAPWTGLPLWLPESDPDYGGMLLADCARAFAAGLATRPMAATIADTLAWTRAPREADWDGAKLVATLTPEREAQCLASFQGADGARPLKPA
ncbi:MAG: NAD-dependent epimerase/dehydratase family protein [Mitsuaria chitosanitabida]|uniref:NAD-dependent epimerase/dehydratase family protein n=1 Tax=Roseateles chitosanitabidus TaxID=65048 RepID=UPI001B275789|nr:NAD-dependent epimerase/dehydratase family protein [Roseateles chitosanitabidus]MBO9687947.1 NAD-dependent epimerase/dehydratase family protein [Roseateles chitosanitabidus]